MNRTKAYQMNKEDSIISRIVLTFLVTPLVFLVTTGAIIAA